MEATSNSRIAKNTLFLYIRMALAMAVSLYTSRVVLDVLGASDYGIYNVVGGVVTMLAFLNGSLSAGTSRFLSYELGVDDKVMLKKMFNVALTSHIGLSAIIFLLAETLGLWFVNTKLLFPEDRTIAVNIVYQMSIFTAMLQFTQIPYNADIIAHEKMDVYAYVSILEVVMKLLLVFTLKIVYGLDMLIFYSILMFLAQGMIMAIYRFYCYRQFQESHWEFVKDKALYKKIFSFSLWDVVGALCVLTQGQGVNILLNMFFGPVVNAARAVSYQVQGALTQLTNNFMTACNPQIVKSFAVGDYKSMIALINNASKYSFFLLLVTVTPLLFKLEAILNVWLVEVPEYTVLFSLIILLNLMIRSLARPVIMGTHATGDIKELNVYAGGLGLMPLPLIYIGFRLWHWNASSAFYIILIWGCLANIAEIIIFKRRMLANFSIREHIKSVYLPSALLSLICFGVCRIVSYSTPETFIGFIIHYTCCVCGCFIIIWFLGINKEHRKKLLNIIKTRLNAIRKS